MPHQTEKSNTEYFQSQPEQKSLHTEKNLKRCNTRQQSCKATGKLKQAYGGRSWHLGRLFQAVGLATETVNKLSSPTSGFGRAKGTVFLVDAKSRQVVWSAYEPPKGSTNNDMDRVASDIVTRIKKELNPKAK